MFWKILARILRRELKGPCRFTHYVINYKVERFSVSS